VEDPTTNNFQAAVIFKVRMTGSYDPLALGRLSDLFSMQTMKQTTSKVPVCSGFVSHIKSPNRPSAGEDSPFLNYAGGQLSSGGAWHDA
jgi:hypothetical protein